MTLRRHDRAARRRRHRHPAGRDGVGPGQGRCSSPSLVYRTGPYAPSGIPIANGLRDYFTLLNERDGGINGVKHRGGGVRDAVRHQAGRGVLRAAQGQGHRRGGDQPAKHRHHLPAHPEGAGRQDHGALDGLRDDRGRRRPLVPLGVQLPDDLLEPGLGRRSATSGSRKAGSTSSRARRSSTSSTTAPTARRRTRPSRSWPRSTASS